MIPFRALVCFWLVLSALVPAATPARAQSELTFATHPEGTAIHRVTSSIVELLSESYGREGAIATFRRWTEYLPRINRGEIDFGIVTGIDAGTRFRAEGEQSHANLRAIARVWSLRYTYIGRAAFGMKNFVGFRGRRIGLVMRNSPTMTELNRALLKTVALGDRDVKGIELKNFSDGINKLARGEIDAAPIIVGVPIIRKARGKVPLGLNYISLFGPRATTAFLSEQVPGIYIAEVEPDERLPEVLEPIVVASFDVFIVTHAGADADKVETLSALLQENRGDLAERHALLRTLGNQPISAPTNPVPYHDAAIAYYREQGLWTPANDAAEARFKR